MKTAITKERAIELLKEHNKEPFHILHGLTVYSLAELVSPRKAAYRIFAV